MSNSHLGRTPAEVAELEEAGQMHNFCFVGVMHTEKKCRPTQLLKSLELKLAVSADPDDAWQFTLLAATDEEKVSRDTFATTLDRRVTYCNSNKNTRAGSEHACLYCCF